MPGQRAYPDELICRVLREAAARREPLSVLLDRHDVPVRTFYHWRERYGMLDGTTIAALRALEVQCTQLRERTDQLEKEFDSVRKVLRKVLESVELRRAAVEVARDIGMSERRACEMLGIARSAYRSRRTR